MDIQWYPGHMTKTKRMLTSQMKLIDVVVELLDARIPLSSKNPDIDSIAKDKKRVLLLNKSDLANPDITAQWQEYFSQLGFFVLPIAANNNDKKKSGLNQLSKMLTTIMRPKALQQKQRGRINIPIRAMIVGIPNVGKSTIINQIAGRSSTVVADRPGVTRGRQWIKIGSEFDLLDTPGVLWPKFEDPQVGIYLACTGAVSDNVLDKITLAKHLIAILLDVAPNALEKRYKISLVDYANANKIVDNADAMINAENARQSLLEAIGNARGFKMKGGIVDLERTAIMLLDEFRGGKLGRITLERP